MTHVTFVTDCGEIALDWIDDEPLMRLAKNAGISGIDADCGGEMVCGTCHVYVDEAAFAAFPPPGDMEEMILECVPEPHPAARLSCQLRRADCPEGARFTVPPTQR